MPDLGRWNGIDQLAESYLSTSPYAYVANNPISNFDVDGRWFNEDGTIDTSGRTPGFTSGRQMYQQFLGRNPWDGGGNGNYTPFGQTQAYADLMDAFYNGGTGELVNQNGTLKWWTDYEDSDPNVTGVGQFNMLKLRRENFPSNKEITPWQLGVEWLSGTGPRHRDFTNGDLMTEMLRQHSHVQATRDIILSKVALSQSSLEGSNSYKLGGIKGVGLYLKDYSTLLTGGLTGNLAVTYLGSYNLEYTAAAYNKSVVVSFHVENSSTMQSASRPPVLGYLPIWQQTAGKLINEKFKTGWGSKTTQSFHWTEVLYLK